MKPHSMAWIVILAGTILTLSASWMLRHELHVEDRMDFERVAQNHIGAIKYGIRTALEEVTNLQDLFLSVPDLRLEQFQTFARSLINRHQGIIQALEWVPRVPVDQRAAFEARLDSERHRFHILEKRADGTLHPARNRPEYYPITWMEPADGPESGLLGFDMASDPDRRDTLVRAARDSGAMVVSERVFLGLGKAGKEGVLVVLPLYSRPPSPSNPGTRRKTLTGFVVGAFSIPALVDASIKPLEPRGIDFSIVDLTDTDGPERLFFHQSRLGSHRDGPSIAEETGSWIMRRENLLLSEEFTVGGRTWRFDCFSTPWFSHPIGLVWGPAMVMVAGLSFTLVLFATILRLQQGIFRQTAVESELRKSEEKVRFLIQNVPDVIMTLDHRGFPLFMNRPFASSDPAVKQDDGSEIMGRVPNSFLDKCRKALLKKSPSRPIPEFKYMKPDNSWWVVRVLPIPKGNEEAGMVIASDVTRDRRLQEQAMRNARLASIGILAASVAHEINNPNNAILFNASTMEKVMKDAGKVFEEYYEEVGEFSLAGRPYTRIRGEIGKWSSEITNHARRIARIVENLKHLSRPDPGTGKKKVRLSNLLQDTLTILNNKIQKYTDRFTLEIPEGIPEIAGNGQQLEQLFINIILNALESLTDRGQRVSVTAGYHPGTTEVLVTVKDQGEGIPEENLDAIFDPFFSTRFDSGGTGLGLSICNSIVKDHLGRLEVDSTPGSGTTITIHLPIAS